MENSVQKFEDLNEQQKSDVINFAAIVNSNDADASIPFLVMSDWDINKAVQLYYEVGGSLGPSANMNARPTPTPQPSDVVDRAPPRRATTQTDYNPQHIHTSHIAANAFGGPNFQRGAFPANLYDQSAPWTANPTLGNPQRDETQNNPLYKKYKEYIRNRDRNPRNDNFIVKVAGFLSKSIKAILPIGRSTSGDRFLEYIRKKKGIKNINLNFRSGTLDDNLREAHKNHRVLLVFMCDESDQIRDVFRDVFNDQTLCDFINKKFYVLGLLWDSPEAAEIEKFVPKSSWPCIAFMRLNFVDEKDHLETIRVEILLEEETKSIIERLKNVERNFFAVVSEENKVKNDYEDERRRQRAIRQQVFAPVLFANDDAFLPNFLFGAAPPPPPPPRQSPEDLARLAQDREIRQRQEEEYKEAQRKAQEMEAKKKEEEEKKRRDQEAIELKKSQMEQLRQSKKESLPSERAEDDPDVFHIVFRLPDGSRINRRFSKKDTFQVLYDFIEISDNKLENPETPFDLLQTHPVQIFNEKEKTLEEVFPDSNQEIIHVREKLEG